MEIAFQRWKWIVAYDGAPYEGWQSQPSGNTVQDHLESALSQMNGMPLATRVHGSGRTDAGVHAEGQVAHVDAPASLTLDADSWPRAMNVRLPSSIRILQAEPVPQTFHARFSASEKVYHYKIFRGNILSPMLARRAWHIHKSLDLNRMEKAAELLQGTHDFRAFAANRGSKVPPPRSTVRTIRQIKITEVPDNQLILEFAGDGFLYRMVRMLTGTLVRFTLGEISESALKKLVLAPGLLKTSACAPAEGLYLYRVDYSGEREAH